MTCPCEICERYEERAAIREHDGGQARDVAEHGAIQDVRRVLGDDAAWHVIGQLRDGAQGELGYG